MKEYAWYYISADDGSTWTRQFLSPEEAHTEREQGCIVHKCTNTTETLVRTQNALEYLECHHGNLTSTQRSYVKLLQEMMQTLVSDLMQLE